MGFLSNWLRRRAPQSHPAPDARLWESVHARLPLLGGLGAAELQRLGELAMQFLASKRLSPLQGLQIDDAGRLQLAAQACLPLLALPEQDWYQGFHEILLYPDDFLSPQQWQDEHGIEHSASEARSGEAWQQGPVILSWPGVQDSGQLDGYNLVIHELAHKLDMLTGSANGQPPLHPDMSPVVWAQSMQAAYDHLCRLHERHPQRDTPIDVYACESPAEFFAVCSEYFFSAPDLLNNIYPQVYQQLQLFYRQNPLERLQPWLPPPHHHLPVHGQLPHEHQAPHR